MDEDISMHKDNAKNPPLNVVYAVWKEDGYINVQETDDLIMHAVLLPAKIEHWAKIDRYQPLEHGQVVYIPVAWESIHSDFINNQCVLNQMEVRSWEPQVK